ncbi:MAG: biopolymer transporter ExbD [Pseudomonadota bacterium]
MKLRFLQRIQHEETDLDMTPFLNLMMVLIPVLLLGITLERVRFIDLSSQNANAAIVEQKDIPVELQVQLTTKEIRWQQPGSNVESAQPESWTRLSLTNLNATENDLALNWKPLKEAYKDRAVSVVLRVDPAVSYQQLVTVMDQFRQPTETAAGFTSIVLQQNSKTSS